MCIRERRASLFPDRAFLVAAAACLFAGCSGTAPHPASATEPFFRAAAPASTDLPQDRFYPYGRRLPYMGYSGANGAANEAQYECSLFGPGGAPTNVFPALAVFTDLMGSPPSFTESQRLGKTGYRYVFATEKGPVTVLWDTADNPQTTVPIPTGSVCLDLMGRQIRSPSVSLGSSPVYLLKRK